jgi:transcription termination/antitermination protein NusG
MRYKKMNYYAIQVKTREERKYIDLSEKLYPDTPLKVIFPRRTLTIRRLGKTRTVEAPLFPGYVFLFGESLDSETYWRFRRIPGFHRFLKDNRDIRPIEGSDRELLLHFLNFGEIIKVSRVRFDENSRIVVVDGPMKGLEGRIVKVDRRKNRAKIRLDLYNDSFLVDLGIDILGDVPRKDSPGKEDARDELTAQK